MEIQVFVLPGKNGSGPRLQIMVDGTTFDNASQFTTDFLARLKAAGVPVEMLGGVEQHKDGPSHVHVHQQQRHSH